MASVHVVAALFPHATSGLRELARWPAGGQRRGSLRRARARSLKRVNGCDTRCSSVRVTMYYELNNVMIGTAPVTRRISLACHVTGGVSKHAPSTRTRSKPLVDNRRKCLFFPPLVSTVSYYTRPVINTVTTILCVSDR